MLSAAQLAKEKGNIAFGKKDYELAHTYYGEAMQMDTADYRYPLNRSMANLKLQRWAEAEQDASTALQLAPGNLKAYHRRTTSRTEQGDFVGARQDIEAFLHAGGNRESAEKAISQIAVAESYLDSRVNSPDLSSATGAADGVLPVSYGFIVAEAGEKGLGAFATQEFHRGDLILADPALFLVDKPDHGGIETLRNVMIAVQNLSHAEKISFLSLKNAHFGSQPFVDPIAGIYSTNAFEVGNTRSAICVAASRFNHSCLPNARYSWHAASGRMRIYALREIAIGKEVLVSYIWGRHLYGSCHKDRQARLKRFAFTCACVACSLPLSEQIASDTRRMKIALIWESVPYYMPHQTADRLTAIIRAIRLLEEEGYAADADDFTNDAAAICACHGDWESVRYWATKTYETRVAEFGEDSHRAAEVKDVYIDLKRSPQAATQRMQIFTARL